MTRREKTKKLILIIFLLIICLVLIYIYRTPQKESKKINEISPTETQAKTITLLINDTKYETDITENSTVYNLMDKIKTESKIDFKEKNYSGMGKFIEEINGVKNDEKYWIYYVNGEKATIGVSKYQINSGDVVSWKYENSY
ncbi:MAG: DUF4430 domain-containing protein [Candidatus Paceibacterota bacterium]|jgi:hypothetical protein